MKILYVAQCGLPNTAPGIRISEVGKILNSLGHRVTFLCRETNSKKELEYNGCKYLFDDKRFSNPIQNRIYHGWDSLFATSTLHRIHNELSKEKYDAVIIYNDSSGLTKKLLPLKDDYKLLADVTEWYSVGLFNSLYDNIYALNNNYRIKHVDKKLAGVMVISPYLKQFYVKLGVKVVEIPPIFSTISQYSISTRNDDTVRLIYCGSPATKDILKETIISVSQLRRQGKKIELILIGLSKDDCKRITKIPLDGIIAVGRVPHSQVAEVYSRADISILFRKNKRYSKAGYSTKFAESLSLGVPVLRNSVGGADREIVDYYNGFVLKCYSQSHVDNVLNLICNMDKKILYEMRHNCIKFAEKRYNGITDVDATREFLSIV